ncbi:MAG TPA: S49 family peptidase [Pirellulales bacterium]|jgi:protease-4|nr:S49 family peptidase [Pirellulales bacterium]
MHERCSRSEIERPGCALRRRTAAQRLGTGFAAVVLLACLGCQQPFHVDSTTHVDASGDVQTQLAPTPRLWPVEPSILPHRGSDPCACSIAVVDVDGLLLNSDATGLGSWGENPVSLFRERLDAIEANGRVRAVVLRINTPGGSVTATDIMWRDLLAFKQRTGMPVVACLMDVAAGGGYYLATAADTVIAHPTTVTGGIGCILNVYNLQDMMAQFNIIGAPIKSGKNIDLGSPIKSLDDDKRKLLQTMADEFQQRFRTIVTKYRPAVDANLETTFDGRVFTAEQARKLHLIDDIGYLDDATKLACSQAGIDRANLLFFHREEDPALSQYAITPNVALQKGLLPLSVPGLDRSKLPSFLYLWQMEPTAESALGR